MAEQTLKDKTAAVVVIPIYKKELSKHEGISLRQCLRVLKQHDIALVCPSSLDLGAYKCVFEEFGVDCLIEHFDDCSFISVASYNKLMLSSTFYAHFSQYEYMLVYQLDAFVFEDRLNLWCSKGYDYVGAPWLNADGSFCGVCGNGGFSLRRIKSFLNISPHEKLFSFKGLICCYWNRGLIHRIVYVLKGLLFGQNTLEFFAENNHVNEDLIYAGLKYKNKQAFKIPLPEEAIDFSFESHPAYLYEMNGRKLPFGCHAWTLFEYDTFWENYIK